MTRFFKLTVLLAIVAGFSLSANQGFAKGLTKAAAPQTHRHRINLYPNNSNPNKDPNWPTGQSGGPVTSPIGGPVGSPVGGPVGGPVGPVKPHPIAKLPTGSDKAIF